MRRRDDNKREAIFQATKELLNEIGFAEISMSKIAKRAGVSAATIYVYFENQDDMLRKLYLDVKGKLASSLFSVLDKGLTLRQMVETAMRGYLQFLLDNREDYLFLEQFSNSPLLKNLCITEEVPSFDLLYEVVERGKREGVFRPVANDLLLTYCYLPISQLVKDHERSGMEVTEEIIQAVLEMSWNAIRA